jgi:hypothetical protein
LSLYLGPLLYYYVNRERNLLEIEKRKKERDPMAEFRYGLRAPDTKRQYPRRFQYLNFLKIQGTLEEQARQFFFKSRENPPKT